MVNDSSPFYESYPYVILYKDEFGSIKFVNLFFTNEKQATAFALTHKLHEFICVSSPEFYEFREMMREGINGELHYWHSRTPRPVQRNITEVVDPAEENGPFHYNAPPPKIRYINGVKDAKNRGLFKPPIVGVKRAIDDEYDETIINTTDGR